MPDDTAVPSPAASRRRWFRPPVVATGAAVALAAAALSVALALGPASAAGPGASCPGGGARLTVQGSGQVVGTPNELDLAAEVDVTGGTAAIALADDDVTTAAVVAAIEAHGVARRDVSTTDVTINPLYGDPDQSSVITGYEVSNSIGVTIRRLAVAGQVLDAAAGAGGNAFSITSLAFVQADPRVLEDQARQDAVRQAVSHAAAMAGAAGERLAGVCTVTDQSSVSPLPSAEPGFATAAGPARAAPSVPLEPGTEEVDAQVTLVYALVPLGG